MGVALAPVACVTHWPCAAESIGMLARLRIVPRCVPALGRRHERLRVHSPIVGRVAECFPFPEAILTDEGDPEQNLLLQGRPPMDPGRKAGCSRHGHSPLRGWPEKCKIWILSDDSGRAPDMRLNLHKVPLTDALRHGRWQE